MYITPLNRPITMNNFFSEVTDNFLYNISFDRVERTLAAIKSQLVVKTGTERNTH